MSRTVIASIVTILTSLAGILGYAIGPEDIEQIIALVTSIATGVTGLLAIIYRLNPKWKPKGE